MSPRKRSPRRSKQPALGTLETRRMPVADLVAGIDPGNPRTMSAEARRGLSASLGRWGLVQPVVWNARTKQLVGGEQRLRDLAERGAEATDVVVVDLPDGEARALSLALNNRALQGEWSEEVAQLVAEIEASAPEVADDLRLAEICIEAGVRLAPEAAPGHGDPDDAPPLPGRPRTRLGDLIRLGGHRLVCGDATDPADVRRALAGGRADAVFTDPPYNMAYRSKALGSIENDDLAEAAFVRLILGSAATFIEALRPGGSYYVCMSSAEYSTVCHQLRKLGCGGRVIIWDKGSIGLGAQEYRPRHEVILYGSKPPRSKRTWRGARTESDVWDFDASRPLTARRSGGGMELEFGSGVETVRVQLARRSKGTVLSWDGTTEDLWRFGRDAGSDYVHPTQKPAALVERALGNSTSPGDLVLDPFAGSGTTAIACERTGRRAALVELDPKYCDVIADRWEAFTGGKADRERRRN